MDTHSRKRHIKILDYLSKTAEAMDHGDIRTKLAAGIVYKNDFISVGINQKKTHPFQVQFQTNREQIFLHAETDAINRALKYISKDELTKCTLYVARVKFRSNRDKRAIWAESRPCIGSQKAISSYGIRKVFHTCDNEDYSFLVI